MDYSITDFLGLLGSLGLFLYGMKVMSDALMRLAGDRMRHYLARATSNRLLAVLTGFGITAVIQSSSATTLMVVSFSNASLLSLTEAISVIMGANIGTTVTAWLIALLGFKVNMAAIALPLIALGFFFTFSKNDQTKHWGYFIIGFSLLFIGLQYLKDAVPDLKAHPEALAFLQNYTSQGFFSIVLFMIIGTLLTVIIQSSSATMAITIIMCFEGWIPFHLAAAMVLGENIGTTITANLAATVANHHAKRTARAHLIFNITGVIWMLIFISPFLGFINYLVVRFEGMSPYEETLAIPVALSLFHTLFNIVNTSLMINFVPFISRVVTRIVPSKEEQRKDFSRPHYLSKDAAKYPETGIKALLDESQRLFQHSTYKVVTHGLHVHRELFESNQKLKHILKSVERIDLDVDDIYLRKIKTIYGEILKFATELQDKQGLNVAEITMIRKILSADRLIVDVVKSIKPLHQNMYVYLNSDNEYIVSEYNRLRKLILKTLKICLRIVDSGVMHSRHEKKFNKLRQAMANYDALSSGRVESLIREQQIENHMATSLMNDSMLCIEISEHLIDIASVLYRQEKKFKQENLEEVAVAS